MVLRTLHRYCFKLLLIMRNAVLLVLQVLQVVQIEHCSGGEPALHCSLSSSQLICLGSGQGSWKEESDPSSLLSNILLLSCTTVLTGQVAASKVAG